MEKTETGSHQEPTDTFINSGFCQVDTPCPLGKNLARFQHLVKDIESRKDDYAAQLSSLTLAGMSSTPDTGEDSEREIINEFLGQKKNTEEKEKKEKHEEKLWQARLVLAIGEILDMEEEEIARSLAMVDDETSELFNSLRGDEDDVEETPFSELSQLTRNFSAAHGGNMRKRLKGWKVLYGESTSQDAEIFITTSGDVVDVLSENYEKTGSGNVAQLEGPALPGLIGWGEAEAVAAVKNFHDDNSGLLIEFQEILKNPGDDAVSKRLSAFVLKWDAAIEKSFPRSTWGRLPVTINIFPGCGVNTLLGFEDKKQQGGVVLTVG